MKTSSLDNRVLSLFVLSMLVLFCSTAFETKRNGMTDSIVAVRTAPASTVAAAETTAKTSSQLALNTVAQMR
jgi:hypothetical protein